jgi:hypothetical protein
MSSSEDPHLPPDPGVHGLWEKGLPHLGAGVTALSGVPGKSTSRRECLKRRTRQRDFC